MVLLSIVSSVGCFMHLAGLALLTFLAKRLLSLGALLEELGGLCLEDRYLPSLQVAESGTYVAWYWFGCPEGEIWQLFRSGRRPEPRAGSPAMPKILQPLAKSGRMICALESR